MLNGRSPSTVLFSVDSAFTASSRVAYVTMLKTQATNDMEGVSPKGKAALWMAQ